MKQVIAVILAGSLLAACSQHAGPKEQTGSLLGAVTGAALGAAIGTRTDCRGHRCRSRTSGNAVVIGALAGTMIGGSMGRSMDERDRRAYAHASHQAFEYGRSGQPSYWHNPDSGNHGYVAPQPAYERAPGEYCREYQQTITVGGRKEEGYGTACRRPDGTWEII